MYELAVTRVPDGVSLVVYDMAQQRIVGRVVRRVWGDKETWSVTTSTAWGISDAIAIMNRLRHVDVNDALHVILEAVQ